MRLGAASGDDRDASKDGNTADLDLFEAIEALKKSRNAKILAHYYQDPDIQDISDVLGDSLALARAAQNIAADVIVLAGVHFMAETAKILNPQKIVLVPDLRAGCSLADSCPPAALKALKEAHPDHVVVTYVNTSAAVKALSDYVCTSTNACAVIASIDPQRPILFAPDVNLGRYLIEQTGRDMLLWEGACIVHETFRERHVLALLEQHKGAALIAHPECEPTVLRHAAFVGSTKALLDYSQSASQDVYIVATEAGILHAMRQASPNKTFIAAAPMAQGEKGCGCSICPYMKLNTLEKVYACLRDMRPQITLDEPLRLAALGPLQRMVAIG